jgi:transcriptional regulator with XRE-family HTH domain
LRALGARIRTLRESKGWSQEELADRAGIDRSYMSGVERGVRNISVLKVVAIAHALGVIPMTLFAKD